MTIKISSNPSAHPAPTTTYTKSLLYISQILGFSTVVSSVVCDCVVSVIVSEVIGVEILVHRGMVDSFKPAKGYKNIETRIGFS